MAKKPVKKSRDPNELAHVIVSTATGEVSPEPPSGKDPVAVKRGRKGGIKGGAARAKTLTAEQRREIARKAAKARWV